MKISIAMATYNGAKYIQEQLESFAKQTILPDEVVITDDGSNDETLSIINEFKKSAPFDVKVYRNDKNLGYTQNFNKAMQLCSGELIFLSDQDDVWLPNKLEYVKELVAKHDEKDLFMIDAELADRDLNGTGLTKLGQIQSLGLGERSFVMGCCIAVRKSFLDIILPIPIEFRGHDNWLVALADAFNLRLIDPTVLQLYRRHESNASISEYNELSKKTIYSLSRIINKILTLYKGTKKEKIQNALVHKRILLKSLEKLEAVKSLSRLPDNYIEEDIKVNEARLDILHTRNFASRVLKSKKLYLDTRYRFSTLLSDIFFD